jgi:hypothetical protein
MIRANLFIVLIVSMLYAKAQTGDQFPALEGESLVHGMINIPDDVKGKYTLIGLAVSKDAETQLKTWFNPIYQQLIKKPDAKALFAMNYDVNVYFIPMLTGAKRPAYQAVMDKVEKEVDKPLHPHVLFFKGTLKEYKDALKIDDKDKPYLYLLDDEGKIIYSSSGGYSDAKLQKIIDLLPF